MRPRRLYRKQPYEIVRLRSTEVQVGGSGACVPYGLCTSLRRSTEAGCRHLHTDVDIFSVRDLCRMDMLDPGNIHHLVYVRIAGAVGMSVPVWLIWGQCAFDERWAVGLLSVWTLSCWFTLMRMMEIYPLPLAFREICSIITFALFLIFTSFRLRAITAFWLVGLCVVSYHLTLYLWPRGNVATQWTEWFTRETMVPMTYIVARSSAFSLNALPGANSCSGGRCAQPKHALKRHRA
jgi:hypothetical protein